MKLVDVERWALGAGIAAKELQEMCDGALLVAVGRLLQAAHRERYAGQSRLEHDGEGAWLVNGSDPRLRLPVCAPSPFGRLEPAGLPRVRDASDERIVRDAGDFLRCLRRTWWDIDDRSFARLESDFGNSLANLVLNRVLASLEPLASSLEPVVDGHTCYPFPALRIGPSLSDVTSCSNLSSAPVGLPLVRLGAHRFVSVDQADDEALFQSWAGGTVAGWTPGTVPLHPWQLKLSSVVRGAQSLGLVEMLDEELAAMPLASQRTCRLLATGYDVKLPIDATLTGERRLLYESHVLNAPIVSALALNLLRVGGPQTLGLQPDVASIAYADLEMGRHLAAIVRAPVSRRQDEMVVPAVLLWGDAKLAGAFLRARDRTSAHDGFLAYCRVLMQGPVEFHARWGMSFEPHLQNSLIRIRDGLPCGLVLRDLDGTILDSKRVPALLRANGLELPLDHWEEMPDIVRGGQRLLHCLLYSHLGQVMLRYAVTDELDIETMEGCIERVWQELVTSHVGATRRRIEELRNEPIRPKSLLTARIDRSMALAFTGPRTERP